MALSFYQKKKDADLWATAGGAGTSTNGLYSSQPNMSVAPKPAPKSTYTPAITNGYSSSNYSPSQYSISGSKTSSPTLNLTNLQKATTQKTSYNPAPLPQPAPKPQATQQSNPMSSYLAQLQSLNQGRIDRESQRASDYEAKINEIANRTRQRSESMIPVLQGNFGQFKQNVYDQIAGEEQRGKESEDQIRRTTGEAIRGAAQLNREGQAGLQNLFANLGTIDSTTFQNQASKQTNDFTRQQAGRLEDRANQINEMWRGVDDFRRQAQMMVAEEETNLMARINEINNTIDRNSFEYEQAIKAAYDTAQTNISTIEQQMAGIEYDAALKQYEIEQAGGKGLQFDEYGQPLNQETKDWVFNNQDKYKSAFGIDGGGATSDILNVAQQLKQGNYAGITGFGQTAWIPGSEGALALNTYEQLRGLLSLENREKLKGSGAISDFEAKVLDKAASRLGRNLSNEQFGQVLDELIMELSGGQPQQQADINQLLAQYGG